MSEGKKRQYTKRSEYWEQFNKSQQSLSNLASLTEDKTFEPSLVGESLYESVASTSSVSSRRTNKVATSPTKNRFKNIADGMLPFNYSADGVDVKEAIELSQKAYFNIPVYRSTIDLMSDFADANIYFEGGSANAKKFLKAWFKRIKINDLKSQFFREYYRSGNIFLFRLESKTRADQSKKIMESYGASSVKTPIPVKYLMLNPVDIVHQGTLSFGDAKNYAKTLTPYELARLAKPTTQQDKELLESLPKEVKDLIKTKSSHVGSRIHFPLDASVLHVFFSKKQDYEPFAVPFCYSVLDDINKKLELKKIDQAIARSIENVVLLVTMGAEPDKGGINQKALSAMRQIFENKSVGRVLVADYTTKAEFIIPDLKKVMGPEKYEVLNKDIEQGLQNILLGESKYADTTIKLKVFTQKMEEAQRIFLEDFLQPEVKRICRALGMRNIPEVKFVKTDLLDSADLQKLVIRMMELGILTPEQGMEVINTGTFPNSEDLVKAQEKFYQERENGFWTPLVNSIQIQQYEDQQQQVEFENKMAEKQLNNQVKLAKQAAEQKQQQQKTATTSAPSGGRPVGTSNAEQYSAKKISESVKAINEFELSAYRSFAMKYGMEELEESKKEIVSQVCSSIVSSCDINEWEEVLEKVVNDFEALASYEIKQEILDLGYKHQLDDFAAAILYHSSKIGVLNINE